MTLAVLGVADLGLTGVAGQNRVWRHPVAVGDDIFWFPWSSGSGWDIIKFNVVTETVTRIPTGITAGFAGAVLAGDGNIYATPAVLAAFPSNVTILRLTPSTNAVATITHAGTARNYGHPQAVTRSGNHFVYAMPGGNTTGVGNSDNVLKITCSGFTASILATGNPAWVSGGAAVHTDPLGDQRLFVSMAGSDVSGQYAGSLSMVTEIKTGLVSSPAFGSSSTGLGQPIYHAGSLRVYVPRAVGGAPNRFLYFDPMLPSPDLREVPWTAGSSDTDTGDSRGIMATFGLPSLVEMPDGTIAYIGSDATTTDRLCTIDPTTNTATRTAHTVSRSTMGGIVGGNGNAYWFNGNANSDPLEWDGTAVTTIPQGNTIGGGDFDIGDRPIRVRGNLYNIHSSNDAGFSSWITVIETASSPTAVIAATPTSGAPPLLVAFDGTGSTSPIGSALTYAWDFGDGATSTSATPFHTYTVAGTYTVTLTVTDTLGQTGTATATIRARSGGIYIDGAIHLS
jgi:hypothetical protein